LLSKLEEENVRIIYLDEFAVAGALYRNYSWGERGESILVHEQAKQRTIHCCVALSRERLEGLVMIDKPFTAETYVEFLAT
jgi:hypothetical protein